jgi:voltage-gated potassium channel
LTRHTSWSLLRAGVGRRSYVAAPDGAGPGGEISDCIVVRAPLGAGPAAAVADRVARHCRTPISTLPVQRWVAMNLTTTADTRADPDDPGGRLAAYLARTQTPLDIVALLTLWIVVVPPGDFGSAHHASAIALVVRLGLSGLYGVDMAIRASLARRHARYLWTHPVSLLAVAVPPVRLVFSLRLVQSMFRRGNLERFLLTASLLVLNGAAIVYLFERHARGSNIHTLGESVWWSVVTVTTVGYGDYYPVTSWGEVTAGFIMAIGILTLAVVTAQVSSSFVDQAASRRAAAARSEPHAPEVTLGDLAVRLARIEQLLTTSTTGDQ